MAIPELKHLVLSLSTILLLSLMWACQKSPSSAENRSGGTKGRGEEDRAVQLKPSQRVERLPDKAREVIPEDGPYRFFDRERRPTAQTVAWLHLKATNLKSVSLEKVRVELVGSLKGVSLGHFRNFYASLGLNARAEETTLKEFLERDLPGVLAVKPANPNLPDWACTFIVYRGLAPDGKLEVTDPLTGAHQVEEAEIEKRFLGAVLYLEQDRAGPIVNAPDIGLEERIHNYGQVDSGTLVRHTVRLFNRGDRDLKIFAVRPTCGCVATPIHKDRNAEIARPNARFARNPKTGVYEIDFDKGVTSTVIPPGDQVFLTGFYDTTNRIGRMHTAFTVISNDPDEREVTILYEGVVTQVVQFDPSYLFFEKLHSSEGASGHVWMRSAKGKEFTIKDIVSVNKHIVVTEDPNAPRGTPDGAKAAGLRDRSHPERDGWKALKVQVKPGLEVGRLVATVQLMTSLAPNPFMFAVSGTVVGNLVIEPAMASFGRVPMGVQATASIRVSSTGRTPFKITQAFTNRPKIMDVKLNEEQPGVYRIDLQLKKGWQAPSLAAQIGIKSNDPVEPIKIIQVNGFVRR